MSPSPRQAGEVALRTRRGTVSRTKTSKRKTEITSRMIDAGAEVLAWKYDPDGSDDLLRQVVVEMYTAMLKVKSEGSKR